MLVWLEGYCQAHEVENPAKNSLYFTLACFHDQFCLCRHLFSWNGLIIVLLPGCTVDGEECSLLQSFDIVLAFDIDDQSYGVVNINVSHAPYIHCNIHSEISAFIHWHRLVQVPWWWNQLPFWRLEQGWVPVGILHDCYCQVVC